MAHNMLRDLVPDGVNHREALEVIISHFGGARSTPTCEVEVPHEGPYALRIRNKGEQIVEIKRGQGLKPEHIAQLKKAIHEKLIESQEDYIAAHVFFSSHPVSGFYRCSEPELQFLSAPDTAPRPPALVGDHPFIFEFPCVRSSDMMITNGRRMILVNQWSHIFNLVLNTRIFPHVGRVRWGWVLPDPEYPEKVAFAQDYYSIPGFQYERTDFSTVIGLIKEVSHDDYYISLPALYGNEFAIPNSLSETLSKINQLPSETQNCFLRAAHWYSTASSIWEHSASSAFISIIAAFESLLPRPTPGQKCLSCGRDTGPGPTQMFRTFLDTYVPATEKMQKGADLLYSIRSNLAHGEYLLLSDTRPWVSFDTGWLKEFESTQYLYHISRIAIINWLYAQSPA